jgi:flagellar M-ring protein FliF
MALNSFLGTFRSLGPAKLATIAAIGAGLIAFFIFLSTRLATPELALLYAELDGQDSGRIASILDDRRVEYELSADGSRIMVPASQVGRLRVAMAEEGLPHGGSIGYEIFDRSDGIGTTSFVQNINHLRALEGEIARTIRSVRNIKQARVHLVLPERQLFSRERQEPSASIVIAQAGLQPIGRQEVLAVQHLVASAVPGLKPQKVSIIDSKGNLLAKGVDGEDVKQVATTAEEMRVSYESRTARMIEDMLARSLGAGSVRAQVTADMDFDRVTENSEIYDPDGQVVRSTQVVEESTSETDNQPPGVTVGANLPGAELPRFDEGGGSAAQTTRTEETVNFDISRTTRTHIRETGIVRHLSVAVMVDGKRVVDEAGQSQYQPRQPEELDQIAALVRSAVGIDESRGDRLEVVNMPFVELEAETESEPTGIAGFEKADIMRLAEIVVLGFVGLAVVIFIARPLISRLLSDGGTNHEGIDLEALPAGPAAAAALSAPIAASANALEGEQPGNTPRLPKADGDRNVAEEIEQMIDINKIEGRVRASSVRKIGEIIQKHPEESVAIVRNWLYQDA